MSQGRESAVPPRVSVLITVRNVKDTISLCLDSLLRQTLPEPFEIVIVDACSNDGTWALIQEYVGKDDRLRAVQRKSTQPEALNYAAMLATGEILAFIDGDCEAAPDWLHNIVSVLDSGEDAAGGIVLTPSAVRGLARVIGYDLDYRFLATKGDYVVRHPNMNLGVRRDVFLGLQFDEKLAVGYDTDFGYRLTASGRRIRYLRNARVDHYHRATWAAFARQQKNSVKYFLQTDQGRRPSPVNDDNINPWWMQVQPLGLSLLCLSALMFALGAGTLSAFVSGIALVPFLYPAIQAATHLHSPRPALALPPFYLARAILWVQAYVSGFSSRVRPWRWRS